MHVAIGWGLFYFVVGPIITFFYLWYAISGGPEFLQRFNSWRKNREQKAIDSTITSLNL